MDEFIPRIIMVIGLFLLGAIFGCISSEKTANEKMQDAKQKQVIEIDGHMYKLVHEHSQCEKCREFIAEFIEEKE